MIKENLVEALRLEVICPAKSRIIFSQGKDCVLTSSNPRFRGRERSVDEWIKWFSRFDLTFESELRKLVKQELGEKFDIHFFTFSGYLGTASDHGFELVAIKERG